MEVTLIVIIAIFFLSSLVVYMSIFAKGDLSLNFFYPSKLYKNSEMNKIGCWVCSIILIVLCSMYTIPYFIWWLFHVGRK